MSLKNPVYKLISIPAPGEAASPLLLAAKASGLEISPDGGAAWLDGYRSLGMDASIGTLALAAVPAGNGQLQVFTGISGGILTARIAPGFQNLPWQPAQIPAPPPTVSDFAISPNFAQDGLILAATLEDGVLRSTDNGKSWTGWSFNLLDLSVLCLGISPSFSRDETVFAGTGSGLFTSRNGGKSWHELALPVGNDAVLNLAISPNFGQDGRFWVGTEARGLWFTVDAGKTWKIEITQGAESPINTLQIIPTRDGGHQIIVSSNTWIQFKFLTNPQEEVWHTFQPQLPDDSAISAICAPFGLVQGEPVWIGLSDGQVHLQIV